MSSPDIVSLADAARAAGVAARTIRFWVHQGRVQRAPTGRLLANGHRELGVTRSSLERALGRSLSASAPAGVPAHTRALLPPAPSRQAAPPAGAPPVAPDLAARRAELGAGPDASRACGTTPARQLSLLDARARAREGVSVPGHIPVTPDGLPDTAALRDAGLGRVADDWDRRMRILADLHEAQSRADPRALRAAARAVAEHHGIGLRTLYRWQAEATAGGPTALVRSWPALRVGDLALPDELQRQIREGYLIARMNPTEIHRSIVVPWFSADGKRCPHRTTVARYIRAHVMPFVSTAFRDGVQAWRAHCEPKTPRELPPPGAVWCADHRLWDVFVLDGDHPRRPWVTMISDVGSAAWVGWRIGLTPTSAGVCHALRSALLAHGVPDQFVRDNGKEFTAKRLGGRALRLHRPRASDVGERRHWPADVPDEVATCGVWQALGVKLVTATPFSPWSKPAESFFYAFSQQWESRVPGYCGRNADSKPPALAAQVERGLILTWEQFAEVFREQADWWNSEHVCGDRTAPPLRLLQDSPQRDRRLARTPDPATLTFLLQDVRQARVHTQGIELGGRWYWSEPLALYVNCNVTVRWDEASPEWAYVTAPDARTLAVPPATLGNWDGFGEANQERKRAARAQREVISEARAEVTGATPLELLDPTGAYRMVAARVQAERETAIAETHARRAQLGVVRQELARAEAAEAEEPDAPNVYEQAAQEFRRSLDPGG